MPISVASARKARIVYARSVPQVVWTTLDGTEHYRTADDSVCTAVPRGLAMRRKGRQHKHGPRHREHYSHHRKSHIWCESGAEEFAMIVADRDPSVVAYRAQAIEFVWPLESPHASHVVDRIDFLDDGGIRLVDVHRTEDDEFEEQAALTRAACAAIGWQYQVFYGLPRPVTENLLFLCPDRHTWVIEGRQDLLAAVLAAAASPIVIVDLCERVRPDAPFVVLPIVYHALWHHMLSMNLTVPLRTSMTYVWRTDTTEQET
ncbi:TnsA-like heteromeric transposase endonuclease subunit [Gordonia amicalis]|uniref:TnsA-like heteromeric transposase endonuclease subunit n=1 Tax=Gordonia amicalis TaxID=89053 RepID=UPI0015F4081B|nr:TnsA-like heteromeric transposase endonuclease subunit [Gordonia amicalis]MBA5846875.1 TnsA-like heteromeric transposase endonuclease subunit [Gordonia amicalis]